MKAIELAGAGTIAVSVAIVPQSDQPDPWMTIANKPLHLSEIEPWQLVAPVQAAEPPKYRQELRAAARSISEEGRSQDAAVLAADVVAIKAHIRELQQARLQDRQIVRQLLDRVRDLEVELAELIAERDEGEETFTNPHQRWIEEHLDALRDYPDMWVAIDATRGIVVAAKDGEELANKLDALPPEDQARLLAVNTTLYV
jgi:hypothetical protein